MYHHHHHIIVWNIYYLTVCSCLLALTVFNPVGSSGDGGECVPSSFFVTQTPYVSVRYFVTGLLRGSGLEPPDS